MKDINRRDFLKISGAGAIGIGVASCTGKTGQANAASTKSDDRGPEQMEYRKCGEDTVSLLGYGCMRWQMIKDENGRDIIDQNSVNELVDYAIAHGINYFDSAPIYLQGQSERATAKALLRYPRDSYFIATKLSNMRGARSYEESVAMYRQSLANYETDHLDYYLLHAISGLKNFEERFIENGVLDFLLEERRKGHIRNLGFSFHGNAEGFAELVALHDKYHWDFVQIQMNYVDWTHANGEADAEYMYKLLDEREIPIVIMEPLLGGQLSNVPVVIADKLKEREPSLSIASWAFRFCGSHPRILTVLSGMTYMEHLKDNLDTYLHFKPLTEDELAFLEDVAGMIRDFPLIKCTGCQYCMPCPYGINIPGIFKHYNSSVNEGLVAESSEQENFKTLKRKYLTSYDKAIESVRQADHCIGCGQCAPRCPQHIRIPGELRRIDRYVEKLKRGTL